MSDFFQFLVRIILEPLLPIPMPWRLLVFILVLMPISSWFLWRAIPWLLTKVSQLLLFLVENIVRSLLFLEYYLFSKKNRKSGVQISEVVYLLGDFLNEIVHSIYRMNQQSKKTLKYVLQKNKRWMPRRRWFFFTVIALPFIWFMRPSIEHTQTGKLISSGVNFWYSLESWAMTGEWEFSSLSFSPEQFIRDYFWLVNNGEYRKAWNLLSPNFRNNRNILKNGYSSHLEWWRDQVEEVEINEIKLIYKNSRKAKVKVALRFFMKKSQRFAKIQVVRYQLIWDSQKSTWIIYD